MSNPNSDAEGLGSKTKGHRIIHVGDKNLPDMSTEELAAEQKRLHEQGEKKLKEKTEAFARDGMDIRGNVHHAALYIEESVNNVFELVFGEETARMDFGVSTRARMLKSMQLLTVEQFDTLASFNHLRNKFIHSKEFNSYTAYFSAHGGHRERVMKLMEEEMAKKRYRAKGPEEEVLSLGVAILIDRAWAVCKTLEETGLECAREPIYRRIYQRIHRDIGGPNGPFHECANNIAADPKDSYTKRDIARMINSIANTVARYFVKVSQEEKKAYHLELYGVELQPIDSLSDHSPSDPQTKA